MVDFSKHLKNPPRPQPIKYNIRGIRKDCRTGLPRAVDLKWYLEPVDKYEDWTHTVHLLGGPTGYESFCIDRFWPKTRERMSEKGWCACLGTPKVWDELTISAEEMKKMITKIKELTEK